MTDELIGKTINGYEVQNVIGQGGMATVYAARQQSMNRTIALKVLPRQFITDDTYLQRFEREVRIVSQLEHRNIVPVYDYGEWEGLPYIAMRYLPEGSIDRLLRQGPLPIERILSIVLQIAPALDYAHSKEVLHRDLKPSNVLLDEADGAFLTDFGIARLASDVASSITTQGVVGTPSYMSPEQAQGRPMDGRSDVYAMGVMLFEMATGRRPFESDTPYSIAVMQVTEQPPMPRSIHPGITPAVEHVILKALRKNPNERYQTAQELANALKQAVEHPDKLHDTQPNVPSRPLPSPAVVTTPPPQMRAPSLAVSGIRANLRRKRQSKPWLALFMGGAMGCGLLLVLLVAGLLLLGGFWGGGDAPTPTSVLIAPQTPIAFPTLDATSESARQTLVARSADNDATLTAIARTPTPIAEADERPVPTLRPNLRGVDGELVYTSRRIIDGTPYFQIVRLDLTTWRETLLTEHPSDNTYPMASPDGRWIAFQSNRAGNFDIYVMNTVGGQLTRLTSNPYTDRIAGWSPDSAWVIYSSDVRQDNTFDLYRTRPDGSETELVYSNNQRKSHARYSPDGRYIVFTSNVSGDDQLYIMTSEGTDAQQITFDGGNFASWIPPITSR